MWVHEVVQHRGNEECGCFEETVRLFASKTDAEALAEYLEAFRDETWAEFVRLDYPNGFLGRAIREVVEGDLSAIVSSNFAIYDWPETSFYVVSHNVIETGQMKMKV